MVCDQAGHSPGNVTRKGRPMPAAYSSASSVFLTAYAPCKSLKNWRDTFLCALTTAFFLATFAAIAVWILDPFTCANLATFFWAKAVGINRPNTLLFFSGFLRWRLDVFGVSLAARRTDWTSFE